MDKIKNQKAKLKKIITLREQGHTFEEIAEIFGVKMNTAYMWYKRLKKNFQNEIDCDNIITNAKVEEIRELEKFKEILNYRKEGLTWKEIAKIKNRKEHSMVRIFCDYKKRHFDKLKPEDYHAQITCKYCGNKFTIDLFSLNKSFNYCSKKCERNYFDRTISRKMKEQQEKKKFEKIAKIKELRTEKKLRWKEIELFFNEAPHKRKIEKFYYRNKDKYN